jgi:CheY-like chemotaxis protein
MLRDLGYSVLEAGDGEEGRRIAQQADAGRVDLLLTDVVMPKMGGKELADWFRSTRPDAKILFTSGYTADAITKHGILQDRVAFLEKPFTPTALARKVREVLDTA